MKEIVFASSNEGKVREYKALFAPLAISLVPQSHFGLTTPEETGHSFIENAIIKARSAAEKTGLPALADDSGLVVDALGGAPGIYSARYAGPGATALDNIQCLLKAMEKIEADKRQAHFYCAMVFMRNPTDPMPMLGVGVWHGAILTAPQGNKGFGYDPVFWDHGKGRTAAEISQLEKNQMSHRALAWEMLLSQLKAALKS